MNGRRPSHVVKSTRVEPQWTIRCTCDWYAVRPNPAACDSAFEVHRRKHAAAALVAADADPEQAATG